MNKLEKEITKIISNNEHIMKLLPYGLFLYSLFVAYQNTAEWNMMSSGLIMMYILIIFAAGMVKDGLAYIIVSIFMSIHFISINFGIALLTLLLGFFMAFGANYGKNTIINLSIFIMLLNAKNPIVAGIAITVYALYFVNRGMGLHLITSVTFVQTIGIYGVFTDSILFNHGVFEQPLISVMEYLKIKFTELNTWLTQSTAGEASPSIFMETLKSNYIFIGTTIIILYCAFIFIRKTKREQKEFNLKKIKFAYGVLLAALCVMSFVNNSLLNVPMDFTSLFLVIIGSIIGGVCVLFLPNYPESEVLTYAEKQEIEEREKLNQVVQQLNKKTLKGWDSIAGYDDVKEELKQVLEPYLDPKIMKQMEKSNIEPVKGLLLFGPPGSGKTLFARAIAAESKMKIISVAGSEFTSKWVGESDKNLRNIFNQAKQNAPCIIFFDELESFLPKRENTNYSWEKTLVTTFLTQMDGFNSLKDVLVIGATNYPDMIDPAAIRPGRFDKSIYISVPDIEAKKVILKKYLGEQSQLSDSELEKVAMKLERFTGADIEGFVKELYRQNKYNPLSCEELIQASSAFKPTVTLDMLEKYEKLEMKYNRRLIVEEEKPKEKKYTWNDIAGMDDVKKEMKRCVEKPLLFAESYKQLDLTPPKGVLLFGPPGCGKTLFAKVIANECDATFLTVNGPELLTGQVGESEKKLRRVFRDAREQKPSIIFFDEFDSIAENRSTNNSSVKMINQLLTEMDGMEELDGVIVIAATNRIDTIDPALRRPGRFDNIVYIGLPDLESRKRQFELYLKDHIKDVDYTKLAQLSEGFSCADIAGVCTKIKEKLLDYMIEHEEYELSQEDCEGIIKNTNKTLSDIEIVEYNKMKAYSRT